MAYGDFKGLPRRTASGKVLRDKALNIAKNLKYDGYQCGFAFYKKSSSSAVTLADKSAIKAKLFWTNS